MSAIITVSPTNLILQQKVPEWFAELLRGEYSLVHIPPHINNPDAGIASKVENANEQLQIARRQYNEAIAKIGQQFFSGEAALQMQSITRV